MRHYSISVLGMSLVTLTLSSSIYAMAEGFYLGFEGGKTWQHNKKQTLQTGSVGQPAGSITVNPNNTGVGGRIFFGYALNRFFGFEMGFAHYAPTTYKIPFTTTPPLSFGNPTGNPAITANGVDFTGKGTLAIADTGFSGFVKLGLAIMSVTKAGTFNQSYVTSNGIITSTVQKSTASTNYFKPLVGIGVSYDLTQNWQFHFSATRVVGGGGFQPVDMAALGVSYHFVDKYCGQFLC